jgi:hypothetical protein
MRLDHRLDMLAPAVPESVPAGSDRVLLDPRTRQALIKLLGRAIDLVGETETRALAPAFVACIAGRPYEANC